MFTRLAVPLDGSAFGDCAIPYAASLARRSGAMLELLHVHRTYLPEERLEALPQYRFEDVIAADEAADTAALDQERGRLEEIARLLTAEEGTAATYRVLHGNPAQVLTEYVQASGAELIVMATRAEGGAMYARFRSISDAVVRHSQIPVLLVQPGADPLAPTGEVQFRRVLVPVDGSPFSEAILGPAQELARLMAAQVELLYVTSPADGYVLPSWGTGTRPRSVYEYLEQLAASFPADVRTPYLRVITHAEPAVAILKELRRGEHDLVAMASHGRGGVRPLLLGSTADRVLRASHTPILLLCPHTAASVAGEVQPAIFQPV